MRQVQLLPNFCFRLLIRTRIQGCKEMVKEIGKWPTICGVLKGCGFSLIKPPIMGVGNLGFQP